MATVAFRPVRHLRVLPLRTLSDERLAELASVGHEDAFAALYERYRVALARYCRSIVRDPEDARDALQNTMVAVLRAVQRCAPAGPIRPWMYRIAHNESISIIRRRRAHEELSNETPDRADTELASIAKDRLDSLLIDLRSLPDRQRGALVMRELGGLDYAEIAGALEMSAPSARKAVFEARVTLHRLADARDADCADIQRQISDGDGRVLRGRAVRGHLLACASCAAFQRELQDRQGAFALMPALPALSLAALFGLALPAGGGGSGSGFALGGTAAGGAALGGGSVAAAGGAALGSGSIAAVKGIAIGGALALAGAGVLVGSGLGSHARHAARLQAAAPSAPKMRAPTATATVARVAKPARVRLHRAVAPPPRVPPSTFAHAAPAKAPPPPRPHRVPAVSSRPNVTGPSVAVPVALTTPTATPAPSPPGTTSTTTTPAPAPTGTPTTTAPPPAVTTATTLAAAIIQNALQTIGANLAAAEAQAAQTLAQAGAASGPATATVQGLLNSLLHGGNS